MKQVTGEAQYIDDIPPYPKELYAGLVFSTKAHAKIISIDKSLALNAPGVTAVIDYTDVPGSNIIGPVFPDEEIFASKEGKCFFICITYSVSFLCGSNCCISFGR